MKNIKDERILQMQNKILCEAYYVVILFLVISVLIKSYVLDAHFTDYISELGIIILSAVYIAIRSMLAGSSLIDTSKRNKFVSVLIILGLSIVVTLINGIKNYSIYGGKYTGILDLHFLAILAITFISSFALISICILFVYLCHEKAQQKIEKEISENDVEED